MRHKQKTGIIAGKIVIIACLATAHATGSEQHPDVPQHPLDGPIPTD
jgi:hypothetical protein